MRTFVGTSNVEEGYARAINPPLDAISPLQLATIAFTVKKAFFIPTSKFEGAAMAAKALPGWLRTYLRLILISGSALTMAVSAAFAFRMLGANDIQTAHIVIVVYITVVIIFRPYANIYDDEGVELPFFKYMLLCVSTPGVMLTLLFVAPPVLLVDALTNSESRIDNAADTLLGKMNVDVAPNRFSFDAFSEDRRWITLLYATNRKPSGRLFSGERNDVGITYGEVGVRIPEKHSLANIEIPFRLKLCGLNISTNHDPRKHFTLGLVSVISKTEWLERIIECGEADCLVFIHGFNTSFEEAAFRFAQIIFDMRFNGVPILFSWPSREDTANYWYDKESAMGAGKCLTEVIRNIAGLGNVGRIHLLGPVIN